MRNGTFSVNTQPASPRRIAAACVRAVQPAVPTPIEIEADDDVPDWVRARPAWRGAALTHGIMSALSVT
jgi:hypothetical protein